MIMLALYGFLIFYQLKTHNHLFEGQDEEEEEEPPVLGLFGALFWCAVITVFIAFLSEFLVAAIEPAARSMDVPVLFLTTILLPIVGNAAEHAAAVIFAMRNKMEISMGVAVGSATQISLFAIPLLVVLAWMSDIPLDLNFHVFETCALTLSVILAGFVLHSGRSDWLKGVIFIAAYIALSVGFWIHNDPKNMEDNDPDDV